MSQLRCIPYCDEQTTDEFLPVDWDELAAHEACPNCSEPMIGYECPNCWDRNIDHQLTDAMLDVGTPALLRVQAR